MSWRNGPLGYGWSHTLDQAVWCERGKVVYRAEDGREIEFLLGHLEDRIIRPGQSVYDPTNRLTLKMRGERRWVIEGSDGIAHEFEYIEGDDPGMVRLTRIATKDGHSIECEYDEKRRLARVIDSGGRLLRFVYDGRDKLREIWLPHATEGSIRYIKYLLDEHEDLVQVTDVLGHSQTFSYKEHLLVKETDRTGLSFYFQYDGNQSFAKCVRTWGDGGIFDHLIHYDEPNRKTFVVDSLGACTMYQRDELGQVIAVTDPMQKTTRYTYDPESGQEASVVDALGREIRCEFDERDAIERRYDLCGRPTEISSSLGFDAAFLRDPMGAIEAFAMGTGVDRWQMSIERDKTGLEKERRMPGGISVRTRRDRMGRPKETSFLDKTDELRRIRYVWEPGDLLKERDDSRRGKSSYFHDQRARLTGSDEPGMGMLWRRPTPVGNIQQSFDSEPQEYLKGGALVKSNGIEYRYDFDGNRIEAKYSDRERETYTWNDLGRLTEVRGVDGSVVRFKYDALGRRIKKTSTNDECVYVWDGDVILHELSLHAAPISWMFEPGTFTPIAKVHGLRRYAVVADQVGAPNAVFDEWGGVAWQGAVDVFGRAHVELG